MPPPDGSTENPEPEPELSIADHEAQFSRDVDRVPNRDTDEQPARTDEPESPAAAAARGRDERGRFQPRTPRERRPESHQATREDVPRISELTRRLRDTERERDEWKTKAEKPGSAASETGERAAPATEPARREAVRPATRGARPTPEDKKADGSRVYDTWEAYEDALEDWREAGRQAQRAQESEAARVTADWHGRVVAAREKHEDFDQVALVGDPGIPAGSLVDWWILEDGDGAEILYYLRQHQDELKGLLAKPPFQQVKDLAALGQRLTSPPAHRSADTGAAAREPVKTSPRPPTPVRTVAQRRDEEPPGDEASLAEHERVYGQRQRRPF